MSDHPRHPNILQKGNVALVVVDMQVPFVNAVRSGKELTARVSSLAAGCCLLKVPIIGTTQYASRMGDIVPEVRHALPPHPAHDKMAFDCCGSETFLAELSSTGAQQVLLCGVEAHICICQTALGLIARGYQVHVVTDAVSSRAETDYATGIRKMVESGVHTCTVEMALYELLEDAGNPAFREVLALIK